MKEQPLPANLKDDQKVAFVRLNETRKAMLSNFRTFDTFQLPAPCADPKHFHNISNMSSDELSKAFEGFFLYKKILFLLLFLH